MNHTHGKHHHKGKFTEGLLDNELILKSLDIQPGQTILDAGCGNGYMSKLFAEKVSPSGKVYALDPDSHFINILKQETQGSNIETIAGDITKPTVIKESSLDLIYISTVVHGFSKDEMSGFLQEVKRILKPGGILAVVEIEKVETSIGPPMHIRYSPDELKEAVDLVPLETVKVAEYFYMQIFRKEK